MLNHLESLKTEIKDVKSDHAMSKNNLNSLNNEFIAYLKDSLKDNDNLIKVNNDILMTKSEYDVNIKNQCHVIKNDTLINISNCIKLKSMHREYVNPLRKIKNDFYSAKKDCDSIQIDLKKLKEEYINNFNKRAKVWSTTTIKIKTNKTSSKNNAACIIKGIVIVDACTSTDDLIVKKNVDSCTSTDDVIVKKYVDACTSTDYVCTNENEPCTNEMKTKMKTKINRVLMKMKMNSVQMKVMMIINLVIMVIMIIRIINMIIRIIRIINLVIMIIRIINRVIRITIIKRAIMIIKHLVKWILIFHKENSF